MSITKPETKVWSYRMWRRGERGGGGKEGGERKQNFQNNKSQILK